MHVIYDQLFRLDGCGLMTCILYVCECVCVTVMKCASSLGSDETEHHK